MVRAIGKKALMASILLAVAAVPGSAVAGGFALREQSAYFQGMSFAGNGTSGPSISSMFWNPASIGGAFPGLVVEAHNSLILPYSDIDGTYNPSPTARFLGARTSTKSSGDVASDAWVPASYATYRLTDDLVLGLGINAPFGLTTKPAFDWAGQYYSRTSKVFSLNVNPTIAYKVNDFITVGAGVQIQYLDVSLKSADLLSRGVRTNEIKGDDIGFGVTAGITVTPFEGTEIGLGYRSAVGHDLSGTLAVPSGATGLLPGTYDIGLSMMTPDMVTLSAKQRVTDKFRVLGTVEWTNWSRLKDPRAVSSVTGGTMTTLHFNYNDGWFFSLGGEYDWNEKLTLRTGLAYEISPIDAEIRSTRLPDNNRWWLSAGGSYNFNKHLSFDLAYTHIIPESTSINIDANHQDYNAVLGTFAGDVSSHVDIFTASLRYKF